MKKDNQYLKNIVKKMEKQTNKGVEKYGQILEENVELTIEERLIHLQEELIDGLFYVEHLLTKDKSHKAGAERIIDVIAQMMIQIPMIHDENTKGIFLELTRELNGALKEMV